MASPVRQNDLELAAALKISRKRAAIRRGTIHMEPILGEGPITDYCGRTTNGNDYCTRREGHSGPCNIGQEEL